MQLPNIENQPNGSSGSSQRAQPSKDHDHPAIAIIGIGGKDEPATSVGPGGYFLQDDIRQFDNQFFGINNREAADMDSQQRNLLEVVFECFESGGHPLSKVSGAQIGCYVATFLQDFAALQSKDVEWVTRYSGTWIGITILQIG
ncbi:polyketide synthase [Penicillium riverlandense]|uniref:polyketide synthase n=1 Tax=Penicillium riverlandense TaxID=1903569 RepID=UPI0025497CCE|nr:polyketide synthase [Penicillium riverlandense]KAJ5808484.1 polyketide synthase [Penicillium riverlandense]